MDEEKVIVLCKNCRFAERRDCEGKLWRCHADEQPVLNYVTGEAAPVLPYCDIKNQAGRCPLFQPGDGYANNQR